MKNYHCFDISFPGIDFDKYMPNSNKVAEKHHAHLYSDINEIEILIFYDPQTCFSTKFSHWARKINWKDFGSFVETIVDSDEKELMKLSFSEATLLGIKNHSKRESGDLSFVSVNLNYVKRYFHPLIGDPIDTGEFFLSDSGFEVVKDFYAILTGHDGKFEFGRMNGAEMFYPIEKSEFRPEFFFAYSDERSNNKVTITKEPKIEFKFDKDITEEKAILYGEVVALVASFYFHTKMDYIFRTIHLSNCTITIRKIIAKNSNDFFGRLWGFKNYWDFNKFLQSEWQTKTISNFKKLSKAIELFNQSIIVDNHSKFLIRYNIIEVCSSNFKQTEEKFDFLFAGADKKRLYDDALKVLLQMIKAEDHSDFSNKWKGIINKLDFKPMKSPLLLFLQSQKLDPVSFPLSLKEIKSLRDNIVHGSVSKIDPTQLEKANILLYRITGILILNLMGIDRWELDTELY